jgi:hypothetical protein
MDGRSDVFKQSLLRTSELRLGMQFRTPRIGSPDVRIKHYIQTIQQTANVTKLTLYSAHYLTSEPRTTLELFVKQINEILRALEESPPSAICLRWLRIEGFAPEHEKMLKDRVTLFCERRASLGVPLIDGYELCRWDG